MVTVQDTCILYDAKSNNVFSIVDSDGTVKIPIFYYREDVEDLIAELYYIYPSLDSDLEPLDIEESETIDNINPMYITNFGDMEHLINRIYDTDNEDKVMTFDIIQQTADRMVLSSSEMILSIRDTYVDNFLSLDGKNIFDIKIHLVTEETLKSICESKGMDSSAINLIASDNMVEAFIDKSKPIAIKEVRCLKIDGTDVYADILFSIINPTTYTLKINYYCEVEDESEEIKEA